MAKLKWYYWLIASVILIIATIINIFVPDPLPFIDEVIMIAGSLVMGFVTIIKILKKIKWQIKQKINSE